MKILTSSKIASATENKYIFFDNDFLSELFHDEEVFKEVLNIFPNNPLVVDPLTKFEFLRSVFLPSQTNLKKAFIEKDIFAPATLYQEIFKKLQDNALLLSKIYAHQDRNRGTAKYSFVDLFLAARLMFQYNIALLVTGNKKDFPSYLFEVIGVINIEQADGIMKPYTVLRFNNDKFKKCNDELTSLQKKNS
ncbi:MAG: hypothetical protein ABH812_01155 [bacterium]